MHGRVDADLGVHGHKHCRAPERFKCIVCWRLVCWCKGVSDAQDEALTAVAGVHDSAASDTGLCNDCWVELGADKMEVYVAHEDDDTGADPAGAAYQSL